MIRTILRKAHLGLTLVVFMLNFALTPAAFAHTHPAAMMPAVNTDVSAVSSDGKMVSVTLPKLAPGIYTVNWVAVSIDSHPSQGVYRFIVKSC